MRLAILSDIHGNREALDACLDDLRRRRIDRMIILGDIVGYGADPAYCVETICRLAEQGAIVIRGNHDTAVTDATLEMGTLATAAIDWTRRVLAPSLATWLSRLPLMASGAGALFVHAEPKAPAAWGYVMGETQAGISLGATQDRHVICGHVHRPAIYHVDGLSRVVRSVPTPDVPVRFAQSRRWLAVAPSVGQPRDGLPATGYAEWDSCTREFTIRRISYDHTSAARKILTARLPEILARRLFEAR